MAKPDYLDPEMVKQAIEETKTHIYDEWALSEVRARFVEALAAIEVESDYLWHDEDTNYSLVESMKNAYEGARLIQAAFEEVEK